MIEKGLKVRADRLNEALRRKNPTGRAGKMPDLTLAKAIGISSTQLNRWRAGSVPDGGNLLNACLVLEVSWAWLLGVESSEEYRKLVLREVQEVYGGTVAAMVAQAPPIPPAAQTPGMVAGEDGTVAIVAKDVTIDQKVPKSLSAPTKKERKSKKPSPEQQLRGAARASRPPSGQR
jgi:transcriptional regulator with XRE-family HTH domain